MPSRSTDPDIPGQSSIEGDEIGYGDVAGKTCNWCPKPATVALPIVRKMKGGKAGATLPTGMYMNACEEHKEVAGRSNIPRPAL